MCEHSRTTIYTSGEDARIVGGEVVESLVAHIVCLDCGDEVENTTADEDDRFVIMAKIRKANSEWDAITNRIHDEKDRSTVSILVKRADDILKEIDRLNDRLYEIGG